MSASNSLETSVLNAYLNNIADDDLLAAGAAGFLYLALHTADPGETGVQTTSEAGYTGYARVAIARSSGSPAWTVTGDTAVNAGQVTWPTAIGGSATCTHWSVGKALSGGSRILFKGALTSSIAVTNNVTPVAAPGALSIVAA